MRVDVHLLPDWIPDDALRGTAAIVIDVLRATTTMATALHHGAVAVTPCLEVEEALRLAADRSPRPLLGGERGGSKLPGFDLGNSPSEYPPNVVAGRELLFTTTNGTRALLRCTTADIILLGAFVNCQAVVDAVSAQARVALVCAGTDGEVTREDALLAGAICQRLRPSDCNDQARLVWDAWQACRDQPLERLLAESQGGRNLAALGMQADWAAAAALDQLTCVPRFKPETGRIRPL